MIPRKSLASLLKGGMSDSEISRGFEKQIEKDRRIKVARCGIFIK